MYKQAYELIREILNDDTLNNYILDETGKHLAIIDAGATFSAPSATILFNGGDFSRRSNSETEIQFIVSFALPFWGDNSFVRCIDFIDFVLPVFFDYRNRRNFILRVNPSINELDYDGSQLWTVDFLLTVSAFI